MGATPLPLEPQTVIKCANVVVNATHLWFVPEDEITTGGGNISINSTNALWQSDCSCPQPCVYVCVSAHTLVSVCVQCETFCALSMFISHHDNYVYLKECVEHSSVFYRHEHLQRKCPFILLSVLFNIVPHMLVMA